MKRVKATKLRLAALTMSSTANRMRIAFLFTLRPYTPMPSKAADTMR